MHVFSHAIGAGLFLGYGDPLIGNQREAIWLNAFNGGRKVTYNETVITEKGGLQTDDLVSGVVMAKQSQLQKQFIKGSIVKIWGCNSDVSNWVYSDGGVTDPADNSEPYYWRAFNEKNVPKPSIAKALAQFLNVKVYGATSGASIEVKYKNKWISSKHYKNKVGHWPSGTLPHRLVPDKGNYNEYTP